MSEVVGGGLWYINMRTARPPNGDLAYLHNWNTRDYLMEQGDIVFGIAIIVEFAE